MIIEDDFTTGLNAAWNLIEIGAGRVQWEEALLRLRLQPGGEGYSDAQISDYRSREFRWKPPLRLIVRACASSTGSELAGTAGFGFWNQPFVPGQRGFHLPQAAWFFFSAAPSNMQLAKDVPGPGWKAAVIDASRWQFLALLPAAPLGFLLMRIPVLYRHLWPVGQRAIGVSEAPLDNRLLDEWHTYEMEWRTKNVVFSVDGAPVLSAAGAPRGPLGFIAWIDNQYAVVTPQGRFDFGIVPVAHEQSLLLDFVRVETLSMNHTQIG